MSTEHKEIMLRISLVYIGILIFSLFIMGRVFYLQFAEKDLWTEKAIQISQKDFIIEPNRGDICAQDGRQLSISVPYYEIRMDLKAESITKEIFKENIDSLAYCLAEISKDNETGEYIKTKSQFKRDLIKARKKGSRYFLVKRRATYTELKKIKNFPIFRMGQYKGGLIVIQDNVRKQPFGNLASRTIGYLSKSAEGTKVGLEGAFDGELRGIQGLRLMQRLSGGVWMPIDDGTEVESQDGKDVITTINVNIQDVAQAALDSQLTKNGADHGCAILMEVATGEIKAIVNLSRDKKTGRYLEGQYNYAIGESTEPGSTFKLASLIAAFEDGYIDLNDTVNTGDGICYFYNHKMKDSKEGGHGRISVKEVFEMSSNVGVSKLIDKYYKGKEESFVNRLYAMNLNEKLGLEIRGEGRPMIKYPDDKLWSGVTLPQMSIGYEISLTPLQILTFYNAVANNGKMIKPHFVKHLRYHGKIVKTFETEIINASICSESSIAKAKEMMLGVVENGTAKNIKNKVYKIAGKTGTAQIANLNRGYGAKDAKVYQASFVGYFPADNPKYSCIVVVNAPGNNVYYGSSVAAPVFKEIADKVYATSLDIHPELKSDKNNLIVDLPVSKNGYREDLSYLFDILNIPTSSSIKSDWIATISGEKQVQYQRIKVEAKQVPKVEGMGLKDAIFLLENSGLRVLTIGKGTVKRQSLTPGAKIRKGDEITIIMS